MARRRLIQQARDETLLRYGPEVRGLRRLLREARSNLHLGIRAENATAEGVKAATRAARPLVKRSYANAGHTFEQAEQDIQTLGGSSSDAAVREAAGARRRMAESLADAESELARRSVDAESGRAYGVRQRRREYQGERGKILQEQGDLEQEMGRYAATTFRGLKSDQAKLNLEKRKVRISLGNLRESRRSHRATEQLAQQKEHRIAANQKDKKDKKNPRFTPIQQRDARAMWDTAKTRAETYKRAGKLSMDNWEQVALHISDKFGVKLPLARAAVQVALRGGVLPKTRRRIHHDYGLKPRVKTRQDALLGPVGGS